MQKLTNFRIWLTVTATAMLVAGGYELRSLGVTFGGVPSYVIAVVSLAMGAKMASLLVDPLLKIKRLRAAVLSGVDVEGYWYLTTDGQTGVPDLLDLDAILFIEHRHELGETKVVATRVDAAGKEFSTTSRIAYIRTEGPDHTYLNYFELSYPGSDMQFGMSAGKFIRSDGLTSHPNILEAHIAVTGKGTVRLQRARRIDDKEVAVLQGRHGADWKAKALSSRRPATEGPV